MGRRELYIALAFVAAGALAYWVTARPSQSSVLRNSLPAMVDEWRQNEARSAARETVQSIGTRPVARQVLEIRLSGFTRVHVIGEDRPDVTWVLVVEAPGPTPEAARASATATVIAEDDLGDTVVLMPKLPADARQTTDLTLRIPAALGVRVDGARRAEIDGAGRVRLEGIVGDVVLRSIAGAVTGSHRNGALEITAAGGLNLNLNGSRATISDVKGEVTLTARNGECRLVALAGASVLDATNVKLTVVEPLGTIRANVSGGSIDISSPREGVNVDARRTRIDLALDRAVPATLVGNETTIALALAEGLLISIDATASNATIEASGIGLEPERITDGARLQHAFGPGPRVTVRSTRGAIVIARRK